MQSREFSAPEHSETWTATGPCTSARLQWNSRTNIPSEQESHTRRKLRTRRETSFSGQPVGFLGKLRLSPLPLRDQLCHQHGLRIWAVPEHLGTSRPTPETRSKPLVPPARCMLVGWQFVITTKTPSRFAIRESRFSGSSLAPT